MRKAKKARHKYCEQEKEIVGGIKKERKRGRKEEREND